MLEHVEYPTDRRPLERAFKAHMAEMVDHHRQVLDRAQQIRIIEQVVAVHMQSRVPPELADPGHRAPDFGLLLIEGKKSHEIKPRATHPRSVQSCKLVVRNAVVNNADAAIASGIVKAFESVQQEAVVTAVNRAMDNDAAVEADRL